MTQSIISSVVQRKSAGVLAALLMLACAAALSMVLASGHGSVLSQDNRGTEQHEVCIRVHFGVGRHDISEVGLSARVFVADNRNDVQKVPLEFVDLKGWVRSGDVVRLPPGRHVVRVESPDGHFESRDFELVVEGGDSEGAQQFLNCTVELGPSVLVTVFDLSGCHSPLLRLWVENSRGEKIHDEHRRFDQKLGHRKLMWFPVAAGASYTVHLAYHGEPSQMVHVDVKSGMSEARLYLYPPDPEYWMSLAAKSRDGSPLKLDGVKEVAYIKTGDAEYVATGSSPRIWRLDGTVALMPRQRSQISMAEGAELRHSIMASVQGYGCIELPFTPGPGVRLEAVFERPALATLKVNPGESGVAFPMLSVALRDERGGRISEYMGRTTGIDVTESGHVSLYPMQPCRLTIDVMVDGGGRASSFPMEGTQRWLATSEVTLSPGNNEVDIELPALHEIKVTVPRAKEFATIVLMDVTKGRSFRGTAFDSLYSTRKSSAAFDATAIFQHVPAGTYVASVPGDESIKPKTMEVPAAVSVTLD